MADINPGLPGGVVPPKPGEASKIQPKKETVRINLPPKPSAAPTIKLPTLPPGGPTGAPSAPPLQTAASRTAPAAAAPRTGAAPIAQTRAAAPVAAQRPAATIGTFDKILAIAACVTALAAVGTT